MQVEHEIKEQFRQAQADLKAAIKLHQLWVTRLSENADNSHARFKIDEAEKEIIAIGRVQKQLTAKLRKDLNAYQRRLRTLNKDINPEYDNYHIAKQLHEYQVQFHKKSSCLLKSSVLNEITIKQENPKGKEILGNNKHHRKNDIFHKNNNHRTRDDFDDDIEFIKATENFSLKDTSIKKFSKEQKESFMTILNQAKQSICVPEVEILAVKKSPSPRNSTPSPTHMEPSPTHMEPSPTPSPPPSLPLPGEPITQEIFLRFLDLVTPEQRIVLEKKRSERKKRPTTSTNRNEYVYGNFDMPIKKKKNNFSYLQQNITPPQTRAQKMRRQQLVSGPESRNGASCSPPPSPPPWTSTITLPSGLTIEPVIDTSPEPKRCSVCLQSDVPSLMVHCSNCNKFFHSSCGSIKRPSSPALKHILPLSSNQRKRKVLGNCPECGEEIRQFPPLLTLVSNNYANSNGNSNEAYKEKLLVKQNLLDTNKKLTSELRRLEAKAENLRENLKAHSIERDELMTNGIQTQKNLKKLLEFVKQFKETSISIHSVSSGDKDSLRASDDD